MIFTRATWDELRNERARLLSVVAAIDGLLAGDVEEAQAEASALNDDSVSEEE